MIQNPTTAILNPPLLSPEELAEIARREASRLPTAAQWQAYFRKTLGEDWWESFKVTHPKCVATSPRRKFIVKVEEI